MKGVRTAYTERELSLTEIEDALNVATKLSDVSAFEVAIRDLFKDGKVDNWKGELITQYATDKKPPAPKEDKAEVNSMRLSGFAVY
ncbi:hypothetical protein VCHA53O466_140071 [Vibrio chagasii]|nr:hypothetical protein VCHA53O466_140071 [Vibrio chagasii]